LTDTSYYATYVNDTVAFTDIASTDVQYRQKDYDLIVMVNGSTDQLTVRNFFNPSSFSTVKQFQFSDNVTMDVKAVKAISVYYGDDNGNYITGNNDSTNRIYGLGGNDTLYGGAYADLINGGNGNDNLYGKEGDDVLDGGAGNDSISGGDGSDTIRFGKGYGNDTLTDSTYYTVYVNDTVVFTDIASTEADYRQQGSDLVVLVKGSADSLTVKNFFSTSYLSTVKQFQFSDNVTMSVNDVKAIAVTYGDSANNAITGNNDSTNRIYGLAGDDYLNGGAYADLIDGGDGNDTLYGKAGDDTLIGGAGNDLIYGDDGNDSIDPGTGNDIVYGGDGADTIRFGKGYGTDQFLSNNSASYRLDTIDLFDLTPADVELARVDDMLQIRVSGSSDVLSIGSYFTTSGNVTTVKQLRFQDGTTWDDAAIKAKTITYGNESGNTITGYDGAPNTIFGMGGDDTLAGGSGNDVLAGGRGNDSLNGKAGNDTYLYAAGDGADVIGDYDTTPGNVDTLTLGVGITRDQLWLNRNGNNLDIRLLDGNANDRITVADWYANAGYHIEQIRLADGATLIDSQVNALVDAMAAFAPPAPGSSALPDLYQTALAPVIAANWK
ncbi:calcium-binding protein, partial [Noviherbaspirillum pedocola]